MGGWGPVEAVFDRKVLVQATSTIEGEHSPRQRLHKSLMDKDQL